MPDQLTKIPLEYVIAALAACFFVGLLAFIVFAGSIASALKNIKGLFEQQQAAQQIGPQPFEVKPFRAFATEDELKRVEGKVDKVEAGLNALATSVQKNGEQRKADIERKVLEARDEASTNFHSLGLSVRGLEIATAGNTERLANIAKQVENVNELAINVAALNATVATWAKSAANPK